MINYVDMHFCVVLAQFCCQNLIRQIYGCSVVHGVQLCIYFSSLKLPSINKYASILF